MADLNAATVMNLRKKTGLPMMECKEALAACQGDEAAAVEWLSKKHKGKMENRADRETGEGRIGVYISPDGKKGGIVELRCETAPVGKNEIFINLANKIAQRVAEGTEQKPDPEQIQAALAQDFTEVFGKLREQMKLGACRKVTGDAISAYVHHDGKSGAILAFSGTPKDAEIGKNTAMHVTFHKPISIDRAGVPADQVEKVRVAAIEQAKEEGKPEGVRPKIADGKVNAYFAERVLLEQEHARNDLYGRKKVKDALAEFGLTGVSDMVVLSVGG
jgi:elongation factor Ts